MNEDNTIPQQTEHLNLKVVEEVKEEIKVLESKVEELKEEVDG